MKVYVITHSHNADYLRVASKLSKVAEILEEEIREDGWHNKNRSKESLLDEMVEREASNCVYLLVGDDTPYAVTTAYLE